MMFDEYAKKHLQGQSDEYIRLVQMGWNAARTYGEAKETGVKGRDAVTVSMLPLGRRKAEFIGEPMGVIVRNDAGALAAVTDLGRATWLPEYVAGPADHTPDSAKMVRPACNCPVRSGVHDYDCPVRWFEQVQKFIGQRREKALKEQAE